MQRVGIEPEYGYIYIITNSVNDKVYIGQTIQNPEERWKEHCRFGSKAERNMLIKRAIYKYGKEYFRMQILEKCLIEELNDKERYYIEKYNSYKYGYNMTKGGQDGAKPLKLSECQQQECIELYNTGFSLRQIATEYGVDKYTVKHILQINNIPLRKTRTYKFTSEERKNILEDCKVISRKDVEKKWNISHSYLSQLVNGIYRI